MIATLSAHPVAGSGTPSPTARDKYDLVLAGAGGAPRCSHVAETIFHRPSSEYRLALGYLDHERATHHEASESAFRQAGYEVLRVPPPHLRVLIPEILGGIHGGMKSMAVDVTGLDRSRIAEVVAGIADAGVNVVVDFFYAPSVFRRERAKAARALVARTESTAFRGDLSRIDAPVSLILGLGYEPHVGVGAVEMIGPSEYWAFAPRSFDASYDQAIQMQNRNLENFFPPTAWHWYPLERCEEVFASLMSLATAVIDQSRVTVVPFGPRIFTAACCAVAAAFDGRVEIASVSTRGPWEDLAEAHGCVSAFSLVVRRPGLAASAPKRASQALRG